MRYDHAYRLTTSPLEVHHVGRLKGVRYLALHLVPSLLINGGCARLSKHRLSQVPPKLLQRNQLLTMRKIGRGEVRVYSGARARYMNVAHLLAAPLWCFSLSMPPGPEGRKMRKIGKPM